MSMEKRKTVQEMQAGQVPVKPFRAKTFDENPIIITVTRMRIPSDGRVHPFIMVEGEGDNQIDIPIDRVDAMGNPKPRIERA